MCLTLQGLQSFDLKIPSAWLPPASTAVKAVKEPLVEAMWRTPSFLDLTRIGCIGFRVLGFRFRVWGLGFRVQGDLTGLGWVLLRPSNSLY